MMVKKQRQEERERFEQKLQSTQRANLGRNETCAAERKRQSAMQRISTVRFAGRKRPTVEARILQVAACVARDHVTQRRGVAPRTKTLAFGRFRQSTGTTAWRCA
jgi:hypothetical protein